MNKIRSIVLILALICIGLNQVNAAESPVKERKTAESVLALAGTFNALTPENARILKAEISLLSPGEQIRLTRLAYNQVNDAKMNGEMSRAKPALYILAIFLPPIAVGIYTDWGMPTVWNFCWWLLFWIPGIIHAFWVLSR